jgi:hypothetical protein
MNAKEAYMIKTAAEEVPAALKPYGHSSDKQTPSYLAPDHEHHTHLSRTNDEYRTNEKKMNASMTLGKSPDTAAQGKRNLEILKAHKDKLRAEATAHYDKIDPVKMKLRALDAKDAETLKKFKEDTHPTKLWNDAMAKSRKDAIAKGNVHKADAERVINRVRSTTPSVMHTPPKSGGSGKALGIGLGLAALGAGGAYYLSKKDRKK